MYRTTAVAVFALLLLSMSQALAQGTSGVAPVSVARTDDPACNGFNGAVRNYVGTRTRLQAEVPPIRVTRDVAEIRDRSNAMALAIQRVRGNARQGEFFDPRCARAITERFSRALDGFDVAEFLTALNDEPSDLRTPQVHMRYPVTSSMATMPANLLNVLPELPPSLEYRLVGRDLVLRDVDAAIIIDYFTQAVPATPKRANVQR